MRIIVTGSLAFDNILDFPGKFADSILPEKIHEINLSFLVKTLKRQQGGTASNIAYNLALLGLKPVILATAGSDFVDYKQALEKVGVDTSMISIIKGEPTASAFIFTDMVDNQITGFYPGAMEYAKGLSLKKLGGLAATNCDKIVGRHPLKENVFVVISPNEPGAMVKFAKECQKLGIDYMFDPGMQLPRLKTQDLRLGVERAKIIIGNDYEIALIKSRLRFRESTHQNISIKKDSGNPRDSRNPGITENQFWITTLGEKGSIIEEDGKLHEIPPAKPKAVLDPTGAGDAYRAGFLAGYLRGLPLETCGRMGSICSVYTVEKYGTQTHKFTKKEFEKRYKENFGKGIDFRNQPIHINH